MEIFSSIAESQSPLARRMIAFAIISEMSNITEELKDVNKQLVSELNEDVADIEFDQWLGENGKKMVQSLSKNTLYIEEDAGKITILKMTELFPIGKSTTFNNKSQEHLKTGMFQLNSESALNHSDIRKAIEEGLRLIFDLLYKIRSQLRNISDELYENYCNRCLGNNVNDVCLQVENEYDSWKSEHEGKSEQDLEDKRTQELLKLLTSGVFRHVESITTREIKDCIISINPEALEHNAQIPQEIEVDCARFARYVKMEGDKIMCLNYPKLGRYLYNHHNKLAANELFALKYFDVILDYIHKDMAICNPKLIKHLKGYEEIKPEELLNAAIPIIETCKKHLKDKLPEDSLKDYLVAAFNGEIKHELHRCLKRNTKHTTICKMIGMLKASGKFFNDGVTAQDLAKAVKTCVKDVQEDSLKRYINEGASDLKAQLRIWTDNYIKNIIYSDKERLFLETFQG